MPVEAKPPTGQPVQSPLWWLERLHKRLVADRADMETYARYHKGDHPLPKYLPRAILDNYQRQLENSRTNFMRHAIDLKVERMRVKGFSGDGGPEAWELWQSNHLDGEQRIPYSRALICGRAYLSVWPSPGDGPSRIAFEDPLETVVEFTPGDFRERAAALKWWKDDWTGDILANVYLPDFVWKFRHDPTARNQNDRWVQREDPVRNGYGVVPIIPLTNRPEVDRYGHSELHDLVPIQDRINELILGRMMAAWIAAYRQKWATGLELESDPNTGEPVQPFDPSVDTMFVAEDDKTRFGTFDATDLGQYIAAAEQDVLHFSSVGATPRHYLIQQGQSPSGDALRSADAPLTDRVATIEDCFAEGIEEAHRLGLSDQDITLPDTCELRWAPVERWTPTEMMDRAIKEKQLGVPLRFTLEDLGYSERRIEQIVAEAEAERLTADLFEQIGSGEPDAVEAG